ncbi:MAG: SDR family NAD(P)-dependent oxidoreductase [Bacteroidota bacterium]
MKKKILITGSTDGIGRLVASQLAAEGHEVIIHGRSLQKVDRVISEIQTAHENADLKKAVADFSQLSQVAAMADELNTHFSGIDVLINNAGVFKSAESTNGEGLNLRFVVNYLAPVLLTRRLLPLINKRPEPRIISLSSAAQAPVSLGALAGTERLPIQAAYAQSKLALTMWSNHLAGELSSATVIAVNPGSLLNTRMVQEAYGQYWSEATKGSDILYQLALSDRHNHDSGKYFDNDQGMFAQAHHDAYDKAKIASLMEVTDNLLRPYE